MKKPFWTAIIAVGALTTAFIIWNPLHKPQDEIGISAAQAVPVRSKSQLLELTPITVQKSDVGDLLGIKMWKFSVQLPPKVAVVTFALESEAKGKGPRVITSQYYSDGMGRPVDGKLTVFVGAYPIPDLADQPKKVKYMVRLEGFPTEAKTLVGSTSSAPVVPDVFAEMKSSSTAGFGTPRQDGGLTLMSGYHDNDYNQKTVPDVELVLTAKISPF